jgi:hypothetical protein
MRNPQRGKQAEQDQADDVVFVETGHAALLHSDGGRKTTYRCEWQCDRRYRPATRKRSGRPATSVARRAMSPAWW